MIEAVVDSEFFTPADGTLAHVEDMILVHPGSEIGFATMVYDFGAAAADGTVEAPVAVQSEKIDAKTVAATASFAATDTLAGILDYLLVRQNVFENVDTTMMNSGFADFETKSAIAKINDSFVNAHQFPKMLAF